MIFDEGSKLVERALSLEDAVENAHSKRRVTAISSLESAAILSQYALSVQSALTELHRAANEGMVSHKKAKKAYNFEFKSADADRKNALSRTHCNDLWLQWVIHNIRKNTSIHKMEGLVKDVYSVDVRTAHAEKWRVNNLESDALWFERQVNALH